MGTLTDAARATLRALCLADLSNGGRGIRNQVEAHLINPLSRGLFDSGAEAGRSYQIREIHTGASTTLRLQSEPAR
jgi:ATP-dependent Clp protease ATP-binding subunit ClpA